MPIYPLYITYNQQRPNNKEVKNLYWELTNENSIVTKAHIMLNRFCNLKIKQRIMELKEDGVVNEYGENG